MIHMVSQTDVREIGIIELTRDNQAPYRAREAVTGWVGCSHPAREILILATSELVTNAVTHADHGHGRRWLRVQLAQGVDFFRLAVTDPGSMSSVPYRIPPQVPHLNQDAEQGRGLAIVANLSRGRWGSHLLPHGCHRVVWCLLDTEPTEPTEADIDIELLYPAAM